MNGFGQRLINARKTKGYNQKQFANILGITPTRLNYWEKDKREPDFFMFKKIVELLDADANELLGLNIKQRNSDIGYDKLNEVGRCKANEYISDLLDNPKYIAQENDTIQEAVKQTIAEEIDNAVKTSKHHV